MAGLKDAVPDRVVRLELISFFSSRPEREATASRAAAVIERDPERVERQLEALVGLHILARSGEGEHALYSYLEPLSTPHAAGRFGGRMVRDASSGTTGTGGGGAEAAGREGRLQGGEGSSQDPPRSLSSP